MRKREKIVREIADVVIKGDDLREILPHIIRFACPNIRGHTSS